MYCFDICRFLVMSLILSNNGSVTVVHFFRWKYWCNSDTENSLFYCIVLVSHGCKAPKNWAPMLTGTTIPPIYKNISEHRAVRIKVQHACYFFIYTWPGLGVNDFVPPGFQSAGALRARSRGRRWTCNIILCPKNICPPYPLCVAHPWGHRFRACFLHLHQGQLVLLNLPRLLKLNSWSILPQFCIHVACRSVLQRSKFLASLAVPRRPPAQGSAPPPAPWKMQAGWWVHARIHALT